MSQQPQQVNVPACNIVLGGLKAEYHLLHHMEKQRKNPLDAGIDVFASAIEKIDDFAITSDIEVIGCSLIWISTLVHMVVPPGMVGLIKERSSSVKTLGGGRVVDGVIDATYTGEIKVRVMVNALMKASVLGKIDAAIKDKVAIAQMLVQPVMVIVPQIAQLPHGGRGAAGFGSTTGLLGGN